MSNPFRRRRDPFLIQEGRVGDGDISGTIKQRWVEETWTGDSARGATPPLKEFLGVSLSPRRLFILLLVVLAAIFVILGRTSYLQLGRGSYYRSLAEHNRLRLKPIPAERGLIFDRHLTPLVKNVPNFTLNLNPQDLPSDQIKREEILKKIAELSGVPLEEIQNKINEFKTFKYKSMVVRDNLDFETAIKLIVASADLVGLEIERSNRREYLFSEPASPATSTLANLESAKSQTEKIPSLAHLLGYQGRATKNDLTLNPEYLPTDFIGQSGLEKSYEKIMRGLYGKKEIEVDALGREKKIVASEPPQAGQNLVLTIDLNLQKILEKALASELRASGKKRAAALALDPQTGEILALVNLPSFNNNLFVRGLSQEEYQELLTDPNAPLFSRAWAGTYPSGSIIKPLIAAGALNENLIDRQTTFLSTGGLQIDRWFFPDWKEGGHGPTNVIKALAESVNTFFFIIGGGYRDWAGLGLEKITEYLKKFGLANTLGLDLPGEAAGFIPSREWKEDVKKEKWYIGDTYNLAIGQGDLLVTPLQVAVYTAAIANGGALYQPHLVKSISNPATSQSIEIKPKILDQNIMPEAVLKIVREGLRAAITAGSARQLADLPVTAAGKTGTAQWSKKYSPHAWFTGFAPFDNPQIVVTVLIEEGGEGSAAAVPVAKQFLNWWSRYKN